MLGSNWLTLYLSSSSTSSSKSKSSPIDYYAQGIGSRSTSLTLRNNGWLDVHLCSHEIQFNFVINFGGPMSIILTWTMNHSIHRHPFTIHLPIMLSKVPNKREKGIWRLNGRERKWMILEIGWWRLRSSMMTTSLFERSGWKQAAASSKEPHHIILHVKEHGDGVAAFRFLVVGRRWRQISIEGLEEAPQSIQ